LERSTKRVKKIRIPNVRPHGNLGELRGEEKKGKTVGVLESGQKKTTGKGSRRDF